LINYTQLVKSLQQECYDRDKIIEDQALQIQELKEGRSSASKSILITSDMHVGHKWSLGGELESVNNFWYEARDKLLNPRSNVFVINGEPIDGDNPKELGHGLWTTSLSTQLHRSNEFLEYYKMDKIGMTRGSNYHTTKNNTSYESMLAEMITCAPILDYKMFGGIQTTEHMERSVTAHGPEKVIDDLLTLRVNGRVFNILHHVGFSRWFSYIPTSIASELARMVFLEGKLWDKEDTPSIIVRSHTHHYCQVKFPRSVGFITPSWKVSDRFGLKGGMSAATIGLIEVVVEQNGHVVVNDIIMSDNDYPKVYIIDI